MSGSNIKTPIMPIGWANVEGIGKDNYNKNGKIYTVTVYAVEGSPEDKALKDQITTYWEENKPNRKAKPQSLGFKPEMVEGEPTRRTAFTFKTNTTFKDGGMVKIDILDYKGRKAPLLGKRIGNESTAVVHGTLGMYSQGAESNGVSLYLKAIQLVTLVEYNAVQAEELDVSDSDSVYGDIDDNNSENVDSDYEEQITDSTEPEPEL